eukprot:gnl/TRDRNA2_/TRDRNA2_203232_c0_seq1.p1 gnl/TRDRNA2_/TRDRNA2_203232_c0~~gnl/TRDRNA2_/TRDRNA2_203232_c0_seq1.p1  ORF type:complete len:338 (-),score=50.80 gnl/TRDRNA2_/TRDRNA2_203232_c0_seq1:190-1155(-)
MGDTDPSRPFAFSSRAPKRYADLYKNEKRFCHMQDVTGSKLTSGPPPVRKADGTGTALPVLRLLQWNLHNFKDVWSEPQDATDFAELVLGADPDVLILQECGLRHDDLYNDSEPAHMFAKQLNRAGYSLTPHGVDMPIVLASRLPVSRRETVPLDSSNFGAGKYCAAFACIRIPSGTDVCIYGTHLNYRNAEPPRSQQIDALLLHCQQFPSDTAVLVVADFNQQRKRDYAPDEWAMISECMCNRGEPEDDHVCSKLEQAGFKCCLDSTSARRNWPLSAYPPPTHWTGTIVDYAFSRCLEADGMYVIQTHFSDHFPLVTDWF